MVRMTCSLSKLASPRIICRYLNSDGSLLSLPPLPLPFAQVVTALGSTWHPEHFVCSHCQKEMGGSNFFEKDGAPYCERDYFQLFSPHCGLCNEPILDVSCPNPQLVPTSLQMVVEYCTAPRDSQCLTKDLHTKKHIKKYYTGKKHHS